MNNLYKYISYTLAIVLICFLSYIIYNQIKEHHLQDDPMLHVLKQIVKPLQDKYPIFSRLKLYKGRKSYTINKDKTFLCLKDDKGEYYPLNMLLHVLLHEISHSLNQKDIGHTEEFHRIFDELLKDATDLGIYNPSIPLIQNYCNYVEDDE
jgi:hypothetical protein